MYKETESNIFRDLVENIITGENLDILLPKFKTIRDVIISENFKNINSDNFNLSIIDFSRTVSKIFSKYKTKVNVLYNTNNMKFFGLYSDNQKIYREEKNINIEIDNLLLRSRLSNLDILKMMLYDIIMKIDIKRFYDYFRNYIEFRISNLNYIDNSRVCENWWISFDLFAYLYINHKCSVITLMYFLNNPKNSSLRSDYDHDLVILLDDVYSKLSSSFKLMNDYEYTFGMDSIDFIIKKYSKGDNDHYVYKRLLHIRQSTEIMLIKRYADYMIKDINNDDAYRIDYLSCNLSEGVVGKFKNNLKKTIEKNKTRNFNSVYDLYYNKFFEIKMKLKYVDDAYTAMSYVREINSVISLLDSYLFENSNISSNNLSKMNELNNMYKNLRNEVMDKKIPKYSYLGIWTPKDYNPYTNPYEM